ncbi:MAG: type II toxin-antitoxin system VapC family toxin, partial [Spirochaetia bacterium]
MNAVDSSAWIEYFADGPNAGFFAEAVENIADLIVPALCLYEVFKRIMQQRGEGDALQAVAAMQQGTVVDLDATLAIEAAKLSHEEKLPMADSIILSTA